MKDTEGFETLDPTDWKAARAQAHRMVDDMFLHMEQVAARPVWQPVPDEVVARLQGPAPQEPASIESVYEEFLRDVLPYPMGNTHPRFWGWYMGAGTVTGALADFLAAVVNTNMGGGQHAPFYVEQQVVEWTKEILGFPHAASGLLVSGASMANLIGLTVARNATCGHDIRRDGLYGEPKRLMVYASSETHSCQQKSVEMLGLGHASLRKVPVGIDYCFDLGALATAVQRDREAGLQPICVVGSAGTINTGSIDDLDALADFCAREKLWFHVDGAIGGVAMLAPSVKPLLKGIERADSVAIDFHKWMHIPFEAGCVLVRNGNLHHETFSLIPEYLARESRGVAGGSHWFSEYGPQLSRAFRALKVWMSIKEHGLKKFGRLMERNIDQARHLARLIDAAPQLERIAPVGLDIVCFRYNPGKMGSESLNLLNKEILFRLHESGVAVPSYTTLQGRYCLRVAVSNHRSRYEDFDLLIREVLRYGAEIAAGG